MVFHAGTAEVEGRIVSSGGRVLNVTARAESLAAARDAAYGLVDQIGFPGAVVRRDIGWRALG
jgi:phosphoribosylamine--glycine ligase